MDRPILFSSAMVRALLVGTKTQTRRVISSKQRLRPNLFDGSWSDGFVLDPSNQSWREEAYPWRVDDQLWVREAFSYESLDVDRNGFMPPWYWADGNPSSGDFTKPKPSIHMPRWASRLTLTVTDVRVQRLQDISEADAQAEGMSGEFCDYELYGQSKPYRYEFCGLWDSLNAGRGFGWEENPWVCAVSFEVERRNIDAEAH